MIVDIVTVTPHRLRFYVSTKDEDTTTVITNAQLVAAAGNNLRPILLQPVVDAADARRLLLGIGVVTDVLTIPPYVLAVPFSTKPQGYCRIRTHLIAITGGVGTAPYLGVDAIETGGLADLNLNGLSAGTAEWVVDLDVEHTLTQ